MIGWFWKKTLLGCLGVLAVSAPVLASSVELLQNPGFELGSPPAPWQESTVRGRELVVRSGPDGGSHSGNWQVKLGGSNNEHDEIAQTVIIPSGAAHASFSFFYAIKRTGNGNDPEPADQLAVIVRDGSGGTTTTLATLTSTDATSWTKSADLSLDDFIGQVVTIAFDATTNGMMPTFFFLDDTSLTFLPKSNEHQLDMSFTDPFTGCKVGGGGKILISGVMPVEILAASADGITSLSLSLDGAPIASSDTGYLLTTIDSSNLTDSTHTLEAAGTSGSGTTSLCPVPIQPSELLRNTDFESSLSSSNWSFSTTDSTKPLAVSSSVATPYSGSFVARLGGEAGVTDALFQTITISEDSPTATLSFFARVVTTRSTIRDVDHLTVTLQAASGAAPTVTLLQLSNLNAGAISLLGSGGYTLYRFDLDLAALGFQGETATINFTASNGVAGATSFLIDAVGLAAVVLPPSSEPTDQIPPSSDLLTTSSGAQFYGPANHNLSYISTGPNEQQVWFGVDAGVSPARIYHNRRYRSLGTNFQWVWQYPQHSPLVLDFAGGPFCSFLANARTAAQLGDVIYDSSAPFLGPALPGSPIAQFPLPAPTTAYKYVMYLINQPDDCGPVRCCAAPKVAGFLDVSFSNDGVVWTIPEHATYHDFATPIFACSQDATNAQCFTGNCPTYTCHGIPIEAVGAVYDSNVFSKRIYLVGLEGNLDILADPNNMSTTKSGVGFAYANNPASVYLSPLPVSNAGLSNPVVSGLNAPAYEPYSYFIDMGMAFDATTGNFYLGRAYTYPFQRPGASLQNVIPCQTTSCYPSPGTVPQRIQVYRMNIGSFGNLIGGLTTGTWNLVADLGQGTGYSHLDTNTNNFCVTSPIQGAQQNVGVGLGAASFYRDRLGLLKLYNGYAYVFGGTTFQSKLNASGPDVCAVTGNEREYLFPIVP